mmetsp:Transcript_27338/g.69147  ORF Transcript_27338/g.69147 Transcript_27338/m.69147 type:complete len:270 (-) Transcript_27338:71-880(-)
MASRVLRLAAFCTLCESAAGLAVSQAAGYQVSRSEVLRTGSSASEVAPAPEVFLAVATLAPALAGAPGPAPPPPALAAAPPKVGPCVPQCTWECETSKCDQVCEPVCQAPRCETRCTDPDYSSCTRCCGESQCSVLCPKTACAGQDCAECKTSCSEPICLLKCPGLQPCHNVCEHPKCEWRCNKPQECPPPQCRMVCDEPKNCPYTKFHYELPPRKDGEVAINAFRSQGDTPLATVTGGPPPFAARWKRGAPDSPDVKECASCSKKSGA